MRKSRKVIQICAASETTGDGVMVAVLYALSDDSSMWIMADDGWRPLRSLPPKLFGPPPRRKKVR